MELELGLALPHPGPKAPLGVLFDGKRVFGAGKQPTLPLFVRDDEGGGGDERRGGGRDDCQVSNKRKRLVGWPPVKRAHVRRGGAGYVKVRMEGVAIGRKVDVSLHRSYDDLRRTLDRMFPRPSADNHGDADAGADTPGGRNGDLRRRRRHPYVVAYEDREGEWLVVGDVPWEAFAKSVKRLKIVA